MERYWKVLKNIVVIALASASPGSAGEAKSLIIDGVVLPEIVGAFFLKNVTDNEATYPGLGQTISYSSPLDFSATAYVYDLGLSDIPDGPTSELNAKNVDRAFRDVYFAWQREVEVLNEGILGTPETGGLFSCVQMRLLGESGTRKTFLCSTGINGKFLKLRMSGPDEGESERVLANFAFELAHANQESLYGVFPLR